MKKKKGFAHPYPDPKAYCQPKLFFFTYVCTCQLSKNQGEMAQLLCSHLRVAVVIAVVAVVVAVPVAVPIAIPSLSRRCPCRYLRRCPRRCLVGVPIVVPVADPFLLTSLSRRYSRRCPVAVAVAVAVAVVLYEHRIIVNRVVVVVLVVVQIITNRNIDSQPRVAARIWNLASPGPRPRARACEKRYPQFKRLGAAKADSPSPFVEKKGAGETPDHVQWGRV